MITLNKRGGEMTVHEYSAGAFVYRLYRGDALFLVLKKKNGEYDLPKGHIEKGENSGAAARREILEETGLDARFDGFFSETTRYFFFRKGTRVYKQVRFYLCRTETAAVKISKEHTAYEWCDYDTAVEKLKFKDLVELMPRVKEYIRRKARIEEINSEYARLPQKTDGWNLSRRFVPGEGRLDAKLMLIGQAPGANEDEQLRPFIGRSGLLLDSILKRVGISRNGVYITSVVQFFPPKNRLPSRREVELCKPLLLRQMDVITPQYVVTLGNLAAESVLGMGRVEKNHGKIISRDGIKYLITFHPAAALRFNANIALMDDDFKKLKNEMKKEK
jgi:DNA polymerase